MHDRDPKDGTAFVLLGLIDEKQGDKAGAEKAYKDAIKLRADLEAAYLNLSALLIDQKRNDDALAVARAGLAKAPSSAGLHANVATVLAAQGDQAGAAGEFDQATRAAPDDPMLLVSYAHWLRLWKQGDAALTRLRSARPLAKDPGVLAAIGEEMKALGAFSDCVPTFDQAIAIKDAPELRTYRAVCKLGAKDVDGAQGRPPDGDRRAVRARPLLSRARPLRRGRLEGGGRPSTRPSSSSSRTCRRRRPRASGSRKRRSI